MVSLERCDARRLDRALVPEPVGAIVADVSFISLTKALPVPLALAGPGAWLVALIKPQFEAGRAAVGKGGIVRDPAARQQAVQTVRGWVAGQLGWHLPMSCRRRLPAAPATRSSCWGPSVTTEPQEVEIVGLGAQGDGIAKISARDIHVPFALPGEVWRLGGGVLPEMLRAHPERAVPVCQHFGTCGGCVAQHMPDALYAEWKRSIVVQAFRHRGIEAPVGDLLRVPLGSRRRITVYARRDRNSLRLGFHRAASHDVLDVAQCPIAMPRLVGLLPALREMLGPCSPAAPRPPSPCLPHRPAST